MDVQKKKTTSPSFVLTLPLRLQPFQVDALVKRFEVARRIYNACVRKAYRRYHLMVQAKPYRKVMTAIRATYREEAKLRHLGGLAGKKAVASPAAERKRLWAEKNSLHRSFGLTKYALHAFVQPMCGRNGHYKSMDSATGQKIASAVWAAMEDLLYGKGKQLHFKKFGQTDSVEGKSNQSGIRYKDGRIEWNGLMMPVNLRPKDEYAQMTLAASRVKYCRLIRKIVRGKMRFFVQLIMEGLPPRKMDRNTWLWKQPMGQETVGLDIGTQTLAICSASQVKLAPSVPRMEAEKRRLLRKLDRQRWASNPHKYHPDGTVKKGNREHWHHSQNYRKTLWRVKEMARKQAAVRKQDHNRLAAFVLSLGTTVYVEDMRYHALARRAKETTVNPKTGRCRSKKRFGRSIAQRAPAFFLSLLGQKLKREGASLWRVATARLKAS